MPQITGRQIIEMLEELQRDCSQAAQAEETKYRGTEEHDHEFYVREANVAAMC